MTETVFSKNRIPVRLTDERWAHITDEHCELAGLRLEILETVNNPTQIFAGKADELLAVREILPEKIWSWFIGNLKKMDLLSPPF